MSTPALNPAERERRIIVRAGLFIALGLGLAMLVVFVIDLNCRIFCTTGLNLLRTSLIVLIVCNLRDTSCSLLRVIR